MAVRKKHAVVTLEVLIADRRLYARRVAKWSRVEFDFQNRFRRWLQIFEHMQEWPARYFSGYYIAVRAERPTNGG